MLKVKRLIAKNPYKKIDQMKDVEAAYLAGLIDGEGSIKVAAHRYPNFQVYMATDLPVLLAMEWGGMFNALPYKTKGKGVFVWEINQRGLLRRFLLKIKPYLRLKQRQAELALKMCDLLDTKPLHLEEEIKKMAKMMSELNDLPLPDITNMVVQWTEEDRITKSRRGRKRKED